MEKRNRLLTADGWEVIQKLLEWVPSGQVVQESASWYSCPPENRDTAHDFGVGVNHATACHDVEYLISSLQHAADMGIQ